MKVKHWFSFMTHGECLINVRYYYSCMGETIRSRPASDMSGTRLDTGNKRKHNQLQLSKAVLSYSKSKLPST